MSGFLKDLWNSCFSPVICSSSPPDPLPVWEEVKDCLRQKETWTDLPRRLLRSVPIIIICVSFFLAALEAPGSMALLTGSLYLILVLSRSRKERRWLHLLWAPPAFMLLMLVCEIHDFQARDYINSLLGILSAVYAIASWRYICGLRFLRIVK